MTQIKAIETFYKGYHFRSRLEARWAVFFDTLGINWKYEEQGYEKDGDRYLPDFFLPDYAGGGGLYVEVKGDPNALKKDWHRHAEMHDYGGVLPEFHDSFGHRRGLILLSDIPEPSMSKQYFHPILQHYKGLVKSYGIFTGNYQVFEIIKDSTFAGLLEVAPIHGLDCDGADWTIDTRQAHTPRYYPKVFEAYSAARSARFEHGQNGATR